MRTGRRMTKRILLLSILAFTACSKKDTTSDPAGAPAAPSGRYIEIKDAMCACPDKACAEKIAGEMDGWVALHSKESKAVESSPVKADYEKCKTTAMAK